MKFEDFIIKFQGHYIDFDGVYGAQCVDLIRFYLVEVLGILNSSIKSVVGAKDMFEKYDTLVDKSVFDRVPNTPTGIPKEGDIVLWGATSGNPYGHVALFIEGNANKFNSFDQNYPVGTPCHVQNHTYSKVLGWLHFKGQTPITETLEECKRQVKDEIRKKNETDAELQEVKSDLEGANAQIISYQNFQKQLAVTLATEPDQAKILGQIVKFMELEDQLRQANKRIEVTISQINECNNLYDELNEKYKEVLGKNNADLKALQQAIDKNNEWDSLYKKIEAAYEDIKEDQKYN